MSDMSDEISNAISNAQTALTTAQNALDEADDATKTALLASERADTAVSTADAAVATTQEALATASSALEKAKTAVSTADTATETANSAVEAVATAKNELSARIDNVGILPFDGVIYHASEISAFTVGQVCLCAELKYFIIADESAQGYSVVDTYNRFDRIGTPLGPNPNYLYRLASKLYRVYDGALCALLTAEEIPFGTTEGTAYEGSAGQALSDDLAVTNLRLPKIVPVSGFMPRRSPVARPKSGIWFAIASDDDDNDGFVIASFPSGFSASDYFKKCR